MFRGTFILLFLALGGPTSGQPVIEGPEKSDPYRLVRVSLGGVQVDDAEWEVLSLSNPGLFVDTEELTPDGVKAVWTAPPGKYRVSCWGVSGGKIVRVAKIFEITGFAPVPPTPPKPDDPKPPKPDDPVVPPNPDKYGLAATVTEVASKMPPELRRAAGKVYYDVSLRATAGEFPTIDAFRAEHQKGIEQAMGQRLAEYRLAVGPLSNKLASLATSNKDFATVVELTAVWQQIAKEFLK